MEYSKLIAVTGLPGLFELINSKTDGAIVRSLDDNSTRFVSSRIHSFSHLESIEVYTVRENVNLVVVLAAMGSSGVPLPDEKDSAAVKKYFEKVYPDMDFERVYASDMKKMVKWSEILKKQTIELKLTETPEEEPAAPEEAKPELIVWGEAKQPKKGKKVVEEPEEEMTVKSAPAKKPAVKKAAAPKEAAKTKETAKAKEAPAKKKEATKTKAPAKKK